MIEAAVGAGGSDRREIKKSEGFEDTYRKHRCGDCWFEADVVAACKRKVY